MSKLIKYLGLDYGAGKIGLAIADSEIKLASPFKVLKNDQEFYDSFTRICKEEKIDKIIIGLPKGLKGTKSVQYKKVKKFIKDLQKKIKLPILEQDEKYTTQYAQRLLKNSKKKNIDDDVAAMLILQSWLDKN